MNRHDKVGFLVHSRSLRDFLIKFPSLRFVPKKILYMLTKMAPPIVVSRITGLVSKEGAPIEGFVIGIPMTARQMMEDREHALKKIKQAMRLAEKKGVGIIGLGALTASLSRGGKDVSGLTKVGVTTGRAYTVKTVTGYVLEALRIFELKPQDVRIAVVGAAGAIGSGSAKVLAKAGVRNFLFIDLERKAQNVKAHMEEMKGLHGELNIGISHQVRDVKGWDIVIAATNAPEVLITSEDLDPGAIIVNDAQPSDIASDVLERDDVLVIEGGVIEAPGISCNFNMGLARRTDTFCCLGEALILAHNGMFSDFALGELDIPLIEKIEGLSKSLPIRLAKIQNEKGIVSDTHIERVRKIILERHVEKA